MINQPVTPGSVGGMAIIGSDLYCSGNGFFYHGIINNNDITFPQGAIPFLPSIGDLGMCAGGITQSVPVYDTVCDNQLPYLWNGQSYSNSGIYNISFSSVEGCDSLVTLNLTVNPTPDLNLGPDITLCLDKPFILDATTQDGSYLWQDGSTNPIFKVTNPGYYWVNLSVGDCIASDTIKVEMMDCNCFYSIPNAITPNGDEINDSWVISRQGNCKTINVFVYNRYGNLVYQKNDYQNDWKGTYKGLSVPDGTYYYIVTTLTNYSRTRTFKGNITILR